MKKAKEANEMQEWQQHLLEAAGGDEQNAMAQGGRKPALVEPPCCGCIFCLPSGVPHQPAKIAGRPGCGTPVESNAFCRLRPGSHRISRLLHQKSTSIRWLLHAFVSANVAAARVPAATAATMTRQWSAVVTTTHRRQTGRNVGATDSGGRGESVFRRRQETGI